MFQGVLDARAGHPSQTLADPYDPNLMPADLRKAHEKLDRAADRLYRSKPFKDDHERMEFLLERYGAMARKNQTEPRAEAGPEAADPEPFLEANLA